MSSFRRRLTHVFRRKQSVYNFLNDTYAAAGDRRACGFSLQYGQIQRFPNTAEWLTDQNIGVIHLIRKNKLKVLVSRLIARKRGVYVSTEPVSPVTVSVDTRDLLGNLRRMDRLVEQHKEQFSGLPYMEVHYEDILANRRVEFDRIADFLNVELSADSQSKVVKTSSDGLIDLIDNYADVCSVLRGTEFEQHLDGI